jgi:hypothetical protein
VVLGLLACSSFLAEVLFRSLQTKDELRVDTLETKPTRDSRAGAGLLQGSL